MLGDRPARTLRGVPGRTSSGLQRPYDLVRVEEDARWRGCCTDELECLCRGSLPKEALPRPQQNRRDDQHGFIRKPMFEECRWQRRATREDKARTVLRLDAANARDEVRSNPLERAPCKTFRTVGSDVLRRRIEAVRQRIARRLGPEARPDIDR